MNRVFLRLFIFVVVKHIAREHTHGRGNEMVAERAKRIVIAGSKHTLRRAFGSLETQKPDELIMIRRRRHRQRVLSAVKRLDENAIPLHEYNQRTEPARAYLALRRN